MEIIQTIQIRRAFSELEPFSRLNIFVPLRRSLLIALLCAAPAMGGFLNGLTGGSVYWYNGDPDAYAASSDEAGIFPNGIGGGDGPTAVWDDFTVGSLGATITGVFSLDVFVTNNGSILEPYEDSWQILNGPPTSGTIVAQGTGTSGVSTTDTGQQLTAGPATGEVYLTEVTGLNVNLAPGTYWLSVVPYSDGGQFYIPTTSGVNGFGSPQAQDGSSYFECNACGLPTQPASNFASDPADGGNVDFSLGVEVAASTPEPSTVLLAASCIGGALLLKLRRKHAAR